jgi:uracil-DNA glycosylase
MTKLAKDTLDNAFAAARACTLCADLPLGPRPVIRGSNTSRLLIVSQAPGTKVHMTGLSFNDRSGDRLRDWLGVDRDTFYNERRIAIMPMGLCYPGRNPKGGDLPPRTECAPLWQPRIRPLFKRVELTLLIGSYAVNYYLKDRRKKTLSDTVAAWREYLPELLPLPHPSWRNTGWLKANPWFEDELVPVLRARVKDLLNT